MFWFIVFIGILAVFFPFVLKGYLFILLMPITALIGFIAFCVGIVWIVKFVFWVLTAPFR